MIHRQLIRGELFPAVLANTGTEFGFPPSGFLQIARFFPFAATVGVILLEIDP